MLKLGQNLPKKAKESGTLKTRKVFVGQIDTSNLANPDKNNHFNSIHSASAHKNLMNSTTSPLSRLQFNVKSVRQLPNYPHKTTSGVTTPKIKVQSTRIISSQLSSELLKVKSPGNISPKVQWKCQLSPPHSSPEAKRSLTRSIKKGRNPYQNRLEIDSHSQEPKIEIMDIALSPQMKKKIQGQGAKQEKIKKLLQSYFSPVSKSHRKNPTHNQTQSIAMGNSFYPDSANESHRVSSNQMRRSSFASQPEPVDFNSLNKPVAPKVVLEMFSSQLSPYEKEEIQSYLNIYFISDLDHKLPVSSEKEFDDERGDYLVVQGDQINYQYEVIDMLGRGSFGQVVKVFDHKKKEFVALKVIRSQKKFHQQAKIEIELLEYMTENHGVAYNITELKDHFMWRNHVCLIFELMSLNLYDFLKQNKFQGFHLSVIRKIAIQILYALKFLKNHRIIHCDLKPENILLKQPNRTGVRLIDFGSSCFEDQKLYTYIQSRFYRSPEIILGLSYNTQIDMWSFGCLLYELYAGYPIFAGESEHDQLLAIMEVIGTPEKKLLASSPRFKTFFEDDFQPKIVPNSKGRIRIPGSLSLPSVMECEDQRFVDLIQRCLVCDPAERYTPEDALAHDWILQDLPNELRAQHMKLIERMDDKPQLSRSYSPKRVSDLLKEKDKHAALKEMNKVQSNNQSRGDISPVSLLQTELSDRDTFYVTKSVKEFFNKPKNVNTKPDSRISKDKERRKETKGNASHGHLTLSTISTTINALNTTQNLFKPAKASQSKENLMSIISPKNPKDSYRITASKTSFFPNNNMKKQNSHHSISQNRSTRYSFFNKNNNSKQLYTAVGPNTSKVHTSKERKLRDNECSVEKSLPESRQTSQHKSWVYPKSTDLNNKVSGEIKRGNLVVHKHNSSLSLRSPKLRNINLN